MEKKSIKMPSLKPGMESAVLCAWLIDEGESFTKGDGLYEIETDKVVSTIEADADGVMSKIYASEGDDIPVGQVIAEIEEKA